MEPTPGMRTLIHQRRVRLAAIAALALAAGCTAPSPPESGALDAGARRAILDKTVELRLDPDLSSLSAEERAAVGHLLRAGEIIERLFELANHRQSPEVRARIDAAAAARGATDDARGVAELYRLNSGPIVTTLDNARLPVLAGVDTLVPGRNVYPWGVTRDEIERWLAAHPEDRAAILDPRTVVRRATPEALRSDLAVFDRHPELRALNPTLEAALRKRAPDPAGFYAVPYAVAWADSLARVSDELHRAAAALEMRDPQFAGYLRLRARDLLANDYEGGDAAWVSGRFDRLNLQLGAYETYDDELYGVKAFDSASLMLRDQKRSDALLATLGGLQAMEDALPYAPHKKVRDRISVGIYDVIADFGQARGTNTASILPNDARLVERYGRTILMRRNILVNDVLIEAARASWEAATDPAHHADFLPEGSFQRVLWHEIGHYLGPDRDPSGRSLDQALEEVSGTFEEMKADLVSLFCANSLGKSGYYDERTLRGVYAAGIGRTLLKTRPRRDQPYGTMELMQMNWYLEHGLLAIDPASKKLSIRYDRYHDVVASLLKQVLAIQQSGDKAAAQRFIERWGTWDDRHQALAAAMRAAEKSRFRLVRYAALGE